MNEFKSAYKNFNGSDYTINEEKYSGFSISKKQIIVDGKNELYSEIITWSTMAIATTLQPKIMALDFALLFAPKDKTPYGSYTQYTIIFIENMFNMLMSIIALSFNLHYPSKHRLLGTKDSLVGIVPSP